MVFNGKRFATLGVDSADVLFYFLESALDFPAGGIEHDHLFRGKCEVGGDQRESETFVIYENDFDLASESLGYAEQLGEFDFPVFAVNMDAGGFCDLAQLSRKDFDRCELFAELRAASALSGDNFRHIIEDGGGAKTAQHVNAEIDFVANFFEHLFSSEPTVADDQRRTLESLNEVDYQFRPDAGFSLEPLVMWQFGTGFHGFRKRHVKFLRERQTCPVTVPEVQQSSENPAVTKKPFRGVLFCGMVKVAGAPADFPAGFAVSNVVKPDQQASVHRGIAHDSGKEAPQGIPRQLAGIEKVVKLFAGGVASKQQCKFPENITDSSGTATRRKRDDECFKDDWTIGGNYRRALVEKFVKFHVRFLSNLNEHEDNIAQTIQNYEVSSILLSITYNYIFDIGKGGVAA